MTGYFVANFSSDNTSWPSEIVTNFPNDSTSWPSEIVTNNPNENTSWPAVTQNQRIVVGVIFLLITIIGLIGNTLVIFAVFASKKLQTFNNIFVVNLSVADYLTCLTIPLQCVVIFSPDDTFPLPNWACAVVGASSFICVGCSVYTLASIGTYRLILLYDNGRGRIASKLQKTYIAVVWIAATWFVPALVNIIPHVIGAGQLGYNEIYHACGANTSHEGHRYLEYTQIFGMYLVPFIIIIVTYTWIFIILRRMTRKMVRRFSVNSTSLGLSRQNSVTGNQIRRRQIVITKNMFYVLIAFIICLTPYAICLGFPDLNGQLFAATFVTASSCVNPFLYGFKHPNFNEVFEAMLKCKCGNVPEQSHAFKRLRRISTTTMTTELRLASRSSEGPKWEIENNGGKEN